MKKLFIACLTVFILQGCKQTKLDYLKENRFDLNSNTFDFPQKDFKILGFGAYHGSAKTEDTELVLLQSLTKNGTLKYYMPEVDYSTAYYYNKFLKNGDSELLKKLIFHNGYHVPQERTIEAYNKWLKLKKLNDQLPETAKLQVLGIEWVQGYRFTAMHLLELIKDTEATLEPLNEIRNMMVLDTANLYVGYRHHAHKTMKNFVTDYESRKEAYNAKVNNPEELAYIIKNLKSSFKEKVERVKLIYENYTDLDKIYDFKNKQQFMRIGFGHLAKSREGKKGYPSLFTRFIENGNYTKEQVISVIGYFMDSHVVWDEVYDDNGKYKSYTIEGGYGIGDYEKEYFRGIQNLKDAKISDKTMFKLNQEKSPYEANEPDLIDVIMTDSPSNTEAVKGMSTLDFLDYAILISDSKASVPIFEMK